MDDFSESFLKKSEPFLGDVRFDVCILIQEAGGFPDIIRYRLERFGRIDCRGFAPIAQRVGAKCHGGDNKQDCRRADHNLLKGELARGAQ